MKIFVIVLLACISIGCSKEVEQKSSKTPAPESATVQGMLSAPRDTSVAVVFAEIMPSDAISSSLLVVQYVGKDAQERTVTYKFRWYVDDILVVGAESHSLDQKFFAKKAKVEAVVVPIVDGKEGISLRTPAVTIKNSPPVVTAVAFSPERIFTGDIISAVPTATDWDGDTISYLYAWEVDGKVISAENGAILKTAGLKSRSVIIVIVTPFDGEDQGVPFRSLPIELGKKPPEITSTPPTAIVNGVYVYQVTAKSPEGIPLTYGLTNAPEGMTINSFTGLLNWEIPKSMPMGHKVSVKITADDGDGGIASQDISVFIEMK